MSGFNSPPLSSFKEPLIFKAEWLHPTVNDVHSRSRLQCLILSYFRSATTYLSSTPSGNLREDETWKKFIETLKMLTSLEVCQPTPIRSTLARLWNTYLYTGQTTQLITASSWLLEQLRILQVSKNPPNQTIVFLECAISVVIEFRKSLVPMLNDLAISLMKFSQTFLNNNFVANVASTGLVSLAATGMLFSGDILKDLVYKVTIPLIESKSSRLCANGMLLMINLLKSNFPLGKIPRRSLRNRLGSLTDNLSDTEYAPNLLACLLCFDSNGSLQPPDKVISSWIELLSLNPESNSLIYTLVYAINMLNDLESCLLIILKEHNMSLKFISESKRRIWTIQQSQLSQILDLLPVTETFFYSSLGRLLSGTDRLEIKECIAKWFLRKCFVLGVFPRSVSKLAKLIFELSISLRMTLILSDALVKFIDNDGDLCLKLIIAFFAQVKENYTLHQANALDLSMEVVFGFGYCLASLIANFPSDGFSSLYRSAELLEQIQSWVSHVLNETDSTMVQNIAWSLSGALNNKSLLPKLSDRCPPVVGSIPYSYDFGPLFYISFLMKFNNPHINTVDMDAFIVSQWRSLSRFNDMSTINPTFLRTLADCTMRISEISGTCTEVAATVMSKILCCVSLEDDLLHIAQQILGKYLQTASTSGLKYHYSQFSIYIKSAVTRKNIFSTIIYLMDMINIMARSEDERFHMLEVMKDIIFPFVCDPDPGLQRQAASSLGTLVATFKSKDLRDGILGELLERSLNEERERYRRGYILGIGKVYASLPEGGSKLDMSMIVGLLSSLAKDPRSTMVQSSAIDALYHVLSAKSNSVTPILVSDIVYLLWQIYMQPSILGQSPEDNLFSSISKLLLVLVEMLGPELCDDKTVSRICKLLVSDFVEFQFNQISINKAQNIQIEDYILDSAIQVILICQEFDDISALLSLISKTLSEKAVICLKWLLEFNHNVVMEKLDMGLVVALCNRPNSLNSQHCLEAIFKYRFIKAPEEWINLINNCSILKVNAPVSPSSSTTDISNEGALVPNNDASLHTKQHLCSSESLGLIVSHVTNFFNSEGEEILDIWSPERCHFILAELFRISLTLIMLSKSVLTSEMLKIMSLRLLQILIHKLHEVPDPFEPDASILLAYQSQITTIFSTSCQDENAIVACESYSLLLSLSINFPKIFIFNNPKVKGLITKALDWILLEDSDSFCCEGVELFVRLKILAYLPYLKIGGLQAQYFTECFLKTNNTLIESYLMEGRPTNILSKQIAPFICSFYEYDLCQKNAMLVNLHLLLLADSKITPKTLDAVVSICSRSKLYENGLIDASTNNPAGRLIDDIVRKVVESSKIDLQFSLIRNLQHLPIQAKDQLLLTIVSRHPNNQMDAIIAEVLLEDPNLLESTSSWFVTRLSNMHDEQTFSRIFMTLSSSIIGGDLEVLFFTQFSSEKIMEMASIILQDSNIKVSPSFLKECTKVFRNGLIKDPKTSSALLIKILKSENRNAKPVVVNCLDLLLKQSQNNYTLEKTKFSTLLGDIPVRPFAVAYLSED